MGRWTIALGISVCTMVLLGLAIEGHRSGIDSAAVDPLDAFHPDVADDERVECKRGAREEQASERRGESDLHEGGVLL